MLRENLKKEMLNICERKILEFECYHNLQHTLWKRRKKLSKSNSSQKVISRPEHWEKNNMHNPYYVKKHINEISFSVFQKVINKTYKPCKPHIRKIDKKGGNFRSVNIFQIPDEALSSLIYRKLLQKNRHRLSSSSYAYRNDKNVHFAIQDISIDIRKSPRMFIAEFDFKDFFGSIDHRFIEQQYSENGFLISDFEQYLIKSFLDLDINKKDDNTYRGIPQGTSLSLFIANMICWSLDRKLENEGLRFARYADDTIIWSKEYSKISNSFDIINTFSKKAGVQLNLIKSEGISLLTTEDMKSELASYKPTIEFLGYSISNKKISIKDTSVEKIKRHISYILYRNLIQPINKDNWKDIKIPTHSKDIAFISVISEIRRYLYGNLNEKMLRNYISGEYKRLNFKGIMSFYPLIDDIEQLKILDSWLMSTIANTLKKRGKLLSEKFPEIGNSELYSMRGESLLKYCKNIKLGNKKDRIEIPSFLRIYLAIKDKVATVGIEDTMHPKSNYYDY